MKVIKYIMAYIILEPILQRDYMHIVFFSKNYLYFFIFEVTFDLYSVIGLISSSLCSNSGILAYSNVYRCAKLDTC